VRIQRAFRRFLAQFPSPRASAASSPRAVFYQEQESFIAPLAEGFCRMVYGGAMMDSEIRVRMFAELRASPEWRANMRGEGRGYVRAVAPQPGEAARVAFTGDSAISAWAQQGYARAQAKLRPEREWRLAAMLPWEVDVLICKFQRDQAPDIVAKAAGREPGTVRLLRTAPRRRPANTSPKAGHPRYRYLVPLAPSPRDRVVGAPGDAFRLRRDMARFLGHALGGFEHYDWTLNPLRRRRVKGKAPRRYIMRSNHGLLLASAHRILRAIAGWAPRMDAARNWAALYPRPLLISPASPASARAARYAAYRLVRRLLDEAGALGRGSRGDLPASVGHRFASSRSTSAETPARTPGSGPASASAVAGYMVDATHAGFFHAAFRVDLAAEGRAERAPKAAEEEEGAAEQEAGTTFASLEVTLMDPHGNVSFTKESRNHIAALLNEAVADLVPYGMKVRLRVTLGRVPAAIGLQYFYEGACGPSSLALLLSLLRIMRARPAAAFLRDPDARAAIFRGVRDEDVVAAVQLVQGAVV
jgi:hypothetical protein